jgi:hypothetical protein
LAILGCALQRKKREHTTTTQEKTSAYFLANAAGCSRRTPSFSAMVEPAYVNLSDLFQLAEATQVST